MEVSPRWSHIYHAILAEVEKLARSTGQSWTLEVYEGKEMVRMREDERGLPLMLRAWDNPERFLGTLATFVKGVQFAQQLASMEKNELHYQLRTCSE